MSRSVKFRRASPSGYDHQRSDSGFSDCESRASASSPDHDYLVPSYEDAGIYSIRQALDEAREEAEKYKLKAEDLEGKLKELRNELEQAKAHMRALNNQNQVLTSERDSLLKSNKELADQNAELQDTVKELKKANRKSTAGSGSSTVNGNPTPSGTSSSDSSDEREREKKVRRSSSRKPAKESSSKADKEEKRGREREREREKEREKDRDAKDREKDRDRDARRKEKELARERERELALQETERLRKRFDASRADDSDARSSQTSKTGQRARRDTTSYIEPLGHGAPRPQPTGVVSPTSAHAYPAYPTTAPAVGYPPAAPGYTSIREPMGTRASLHASSVHPAVFVADEYAGYPPVEEDDAGSYHTIPHSRYGR
ncbi:hypothetical protein VTJ04DRAFT_8592 [Mycothermus thermophilus]|uniref:uncharacterized protein n=1 Tax=Humicola insolens TaxID=85995 RepID=UPI0037425BE7